MEYFWAILISLIVILIVWGIIYNKFKARKIRKHMEKIFPKGIDHIQENRKYNIFLSHGATLNNAKFIGITPSYEHNNPYLPLPLCQWLIVEKENGKRAFLKPGTVRFYEEADYESKPLAIQ